MGCCNVVAILSMADMVCLACMQKLEQSFVMYIVGKIAQDVGMVM